MHTLDLDGLAATASLAARVAAALEPGDTLALTGDLGAGKTTFVRALIAARAGGPVEVPSPTFTLVQTYPLPGATLWHFDLYRLSRPEEALELGLDEALDDGIALIEWPERLGPFLPQRRLELTLAITGPEQRRATLGAGPGWGRPLP